MDGSRSGGGGGGGEGCRFESGKKKYEVERKVDAETS